MRKLWAIFWRDLQSASSYRLGFLLQFIAPLFMLVSFFFVGRLLKGATIPGLDRYGGDYFSFALVGLVYGTYVSIALTTVVSVVRQGQMLGTLEVVLTTPTSLATLIAGSSMYAIIRATLFSLLYLALGALVFGVGFRGANVLGGVLAMLLSMMVMLGLGIWSGAFVLMFKQGDPFSLILTSGSFLLSGVVYPVAVLPGWLQVASAALPQTYALEALRLALLRGAPLGQLIPLLGTLSLFAMVILPVSLLVFKYAVHRARTEGSFAQF